MNRKGIVLTVLLTLVVCLAATGTALAMSSSSYDLPWTALSGGGEEGRNSASYVLGDTMGQSSAIGSSESTNYRLDSGYWYGVPLPTCIPGDANGDGVVNVLDLVKVKRIILGLDPPTCGADANQDGNIDVLDLVKIKRIILGLD